MRRNAHDLDPHALYEAAVQGVEFDLDFVERIYRRRHRVPPKLLREDFCGTAAMACAWVARRSDHRAIGVDRNASTLRWASRHHLARMGRAGRRVTLIRSDVRRITRPRVDVVAALNFSYWVLKRRRDLLDYFRAARRSLLPRGLFLVNAFGGTEAMMPLRERTRVAASQGPDGRRIPAFTYVWEQESFNPVDHHLVCHMHFRLPGGRWMKKAFNYDWRLWTLPEIQDAMREVGFSASEVHVEGWNEETGKANGIYRKRTRFENQEGWLAYVVGWK